MKRNEIEIMQDCVNISKNCIKSFLKDKYEFRKLGMKKAENWCNNEMWKSRHVLQRDLETLKYLRSSKVCSKD